ncbi:MAG: MerR family transcriptional regulator [Gemmatimonadota bacterium]
MEITVGELALRTGLTVRTLHHYDDIGLLAPVSRSPAGYRLYGPGDVRRLQRIVSLRALGLPLADIADSLDRPEMTLGRVLRMHAERLDRQLDSLRALRERVRSLAGRLDAEGGVSAEELIALMEMTTMFEKHFTAEQLQTLAARREELGEDVIRAAEEEWPRLIARARAAMEAELPLDDPEVREIAARWRELTEAFTGGDEGIADAVRDVYWSEPEARQMAGFDPDIWAFIARASAAAR